MKCTVTLQKTNPSALKEMVTFQSRIIPTNGRKRGSKVVDSKDFGVLLCFAEYHPGGSPKIRSGISKHEALARDKTFIKESLTDVSGCDVASLP